MKKAMIAGLCATLLMSLGGCANDASLSRKAAFALHTTADQVTISDRRTEEIGMKTSFYATYKDKKYQCYTGSLFGMPISDAICAGTDGTPAPCNALLQAAGRCQ